MKKMLLAMAIGAGVAWLCDPDNGPRRRDMVRHRLEEKGLLSSSGASADVLSDTAPSSVASIR